MKTNIEDISLLDAYIRGQLNDTEIKNVEIRLAKESDLMEDLEMLKKVRQDARVNSLKTVWDDIQNFESEYKTNNNPNAAPIKKMNLVWIFFAAIFTGILVAGWFWIKKQNGHPQEYADIFDKRFEKEMIIHVTYRSTQQDTQLTKQQKQAYDLYALKEFKTAIPMLKRLWETERDTLALYYWGISELGVGQVSKSREILSDPALIRYNTSFIHKSNTK
jgi:hypothetical protein